VQVTVDDWTLEATQVDGPQWSQVLSDHNHLLFHQPVWARVLGDGFGCPVDGLTISHSGELAGGLLGMRLRRLGIGIGYFGFPYGGVVGRSPAGGTLAKLLSLYCRQLGLSQMKLIGFPGESPSATEGFVVVEDDTQLLSLEGKEAESVQNGYAENVRRDIRRAEREGVSVRNDDSADGVERFCELYEAVMRRRRAIARYPRDLFRAAVQSLRAEDRVSLLLAEVEQQVVAGLLVVDSPRMSHYLMGGSLEDASPVRANHLLFHRAILRAIDRGLDAFDFLPSGHDNPGLREFKRKWGALPVELANRRLDVRAFRCAVLNAGNACTHWKPARGVFERLYRGG
jgi:hypothetical protein